MKKLIFSAATLGLLAFANTSNAQTFYCEGYHANAEAGKTVEKATGGYNPDKMDRVKSDFVRDIVCHDKADKSSPEHETNHETNHESPSHETEHSSTEHEHAHETHPTHD